MVRPLAGRRIIVTRPAGAEALAARLAALGAEVLELPTTRIEVMDLAPLRSALARLPEYRWVVLTSRVAVQLVAGEAGRVAAGAGVLAATSVCTVGPGTAAALAASGIAPSLIPDRFDAEGVVAALDRAGVAGARVLYPAAAGARDVIPAGLRAAGAAVDVVPIYRSVPDGAAAVRLRELFATAAADAVTVTSASVARGLAEAVGPEIAARVPAVSIGPVTTHAARQAGLDVRAEAREASLNGLVEAVAQLW